MIRFGVESLLFPFQGCTQESISNDSLSSMSVYWKSAVVALSSCNIKTMSQHLVAQSILALVYRLTKEMLASSVQD